MNPNDYPTKANLIKAQQELKLTRRGYILLDKKRQALLAEYLREETYMEKLRREASLAVDAAYAALAEAHLELGQDYVSQITDPSLLPSTTAATDAAFFSWKKAKKLLIRLVFQGEKLFNLSKALQKTQKKAVALEKIIIPKQEARIKFIQMQLEERSRDEIIRLKKQNVMIYW